MYNYREFYNDYRQFTDEEFNNMMNNNSMNNMNNNSLSLYTPTEGYNKGNLFSNLYDDYKNYKPVNLEGKDNKTKLWLDMNRVLFALHEINLYLDVNPNNQSMVQLFSDYSRKANELMMEYEKNYGPLTTINESNLNSSFNWVEEKFPWEGGNN